VGVSPGTPDSMGWLDCDVLLLGAGSPSPPVAMHADKSSARVTAQVRAIGWRLQECISHHHYLCCPGSSLG
jgi:hypothetical protein